MPVTISKKSPVLCKFGENSSKNINLQKKKMFSPRFCVKTAIRHCMEAWLSLETTWVTNFNWPIKFSKTHFRAPLKNFCERSWSTRYFNWKLASCSEDTLIVINYKLNQAALDFLVIELRCFQLFLARVLILPGHFCQPKNIFEVEFSTCCGLSS